MSIDKKLYCLGDRRELINISCSAGLLESGVITSLIDGKEDDNLYFNSNKKNQWLLFEFKNSPICINTIIWKQSDGYTQGKWQLQGSNDNKHFIDIDNSIMLNNGVFKINNNGLFKFYKLQQIEGETTRSAWIYEIEFGIKTVVPYFLLEQNKRLYTIKSQYYDKLQSQYTPIAQINIDNVNDKDLQQFGFNNIEDICAEVILDGEKFRPIDKLKALNNGSFNILVKDIDYNS